MPDAVSYMKAVGRLAWRAIRERGRDPSISHVANLVADRWGLTVTAPEIELYLRATGGEVLKRSRGGKDVLPPLFPAIWETRLLIELLSDPAAPPVRGAVVHLESELMQIRGAEPSAIFRYRLELDRVERRSSGHLIRVVGRSWNSAGHQCTESRDSFLLRDRRLSEHSRSAPAGGKDTEREERAEREQREWREIARWRLRSNHGRRYARASGDYNPVHLSRLTAIPLGFRRPILHGFCTAAMATHELLATFCEGDLSSLRRLRVSFRRPLPLPSRPRLVAAEDGSRIRFLVLDEHERTSVQGELVAAMDPGRRSAER